MYRPALLLFGVLATSVLAEQRVQFDNYASGAELLTRQTGTCSAGRKVCDDGCILTTSTCCNDGSAGSCPIGYRCDGTGANAGCCPTGKVCDDSPPSGCTALSKLCGSDCIPQSQTCSVGSGSTGSGSTGSGSSGSSSTITYSTSSRTSTRTSSTSTPTSTADSGSTGSTSSSGTTTPSGNTGSTSNAGSSGSTASGGGGTAGAASSNMIIGQGAVLASLLAFFAL